MDRVWRTAELVPKHVRVQCPIMDRAKKKKPSALANPCSTCAAPCFSRRGSDSNAQLIQPRRPTPCKTKLQIPRSVVVSAAVCRLCPRRAVSRACPIISHHAHVRILRVLASLVQESLLARQSFADEVESPFGGVHPNRRNHGARGLLISACVSLRHMARIRPATVVAQSLASSGRKSQLNAVLQNLKQCICHGRLAKCQFRPQRAKVQRAHLRVLRCASARACGRRSFRYTWDS